MRTIHEPIISKQIYQELYCLFFDYLSKTVQKEILISQKGLFAFSYWIEKKMFGAL